MLENNVFRLMMLIGAIILCAFVIDSFITYYPEIKEVINNLMAKRVTYY